MSGSVGMITRRCERCESEFDVWPSRVKHGRGRHCSPACQYAAIKDRPGAAVECICVGCGQSFMRAKSPSKKGGGKYCNRACRDAHWKGSLNPNFQDGLSISSRGPHWAKIKRDVRRRDGCCRSCGHVGRLDVHHIVPFRMFDDHRDANQLDNLVALCRPCHRREDAARKWIKIGGVILMMPAISPLWQLAREKKMTKWEPTDPAEYGAPRGDR